MEDEVFAKSHLGYCDERNGSVFLAIQIFVLLILTPNMLELQFLLNY